MSTPPPAPEETAPDLSVLVPVYNEAANLGPLHAEQALLDCATELEELGLIPRDLSPEHLRTGVDEP